MMWKSETFGSKQFLWKKKAERSFLCGVPLPQILPFFSCHSLKIKKDTQMDSDSVRQQQNGSGQKDQESMTKKMANMSVFDTGQVGQANRAMTHQQTLYNHPPHSPLNQQPHHPPPPQQQQHSEYIPCQYGGGYQTSRSVYTLSDSSSSPMMMSMSSTKTRSKTSSDSTTKMTTCNNSSPRS